MTASRWVWVLVLLIGMAATAMLVKSGNARDKVDRVGAPLPEGSYRVSIDNLIQGEDISINTLSIETSPKAWIRILGEKPQGGGGGALAGDNAPDGSPPKARLTLIGDQIEWSAGNANVRRFLMRLEGGGGVCTSSNMGPMEAGKKLESILTLSIKPGLYPYEQPIKLLNFEGRSFELTVYKKTPRDPG
jgi:hypothetical protein